VHYRGETTGRDVGLHYIRTKDGAEVGFCLSCDGALDQLLACKVSDTRPQRALLRFAAQWADAEAVQLVRDARQVERRGVIAIEPAAAWFARLDA